MRNRRNQVAMGVAFTFLTLVLVLLSACGGSGDDPQVPTGLALSADSEELILGASVELEAMVLYERDVPACDWSVNGVVGGTAETGTISQDNPAIYTAPVLDTGLETVEISAVWRSDTSITGEIGLTLQVPLLVLSVDEDEIQLGETLEFTAALEADRDITDFDWFVNETLGGDATLGTITQGNPAVYTAPQALPLGGGVLVNAKWRDNPEIAASEMLYLLFTIKHVNAATGLDEPGRGTITAPLKTITYACENENHEDGDTILVAPGVYNHALGEANSISTPYNVTIRGIDRDQCFVDGNPAHDGAIFYMNGTTFENFTLRNPGYPDSDMRYAIQFQSYDAVARNIKINDAFVNSAIYVTNTDRNPLMVDCEIACTQAPGLEDGIKCNPNTKPSFVDCEISGWDRGMIAADSMLIQGCTITGNEIGVYVSTSEASPDMGGGAWGCLGGNSIQLNNWGIWNSSDLDVFAQFNNWNEDPPVHGADAPSDIYNTAAGVVIWE